MSININYKTPLTVRMYVNILIVMFFIDIFPYMSKPSVCTHQVCFGYKFLSITSDKYSHIFSGNILWILFMKSRRNTESHVGSNSTSGMYYPVKVNLIFKDRYSKDFFFILEVEALFSLFYIQD